MKNNNNNNNNPKPLSIIVIGNAHTEFTLYATLINLFKKLNKLKIPYAFLEEGPAEQSLNEVFQSKMDGLNQTKIIKEFIPEIKNYYRYDGYGFHLPLNKWNTIHEIVKNKVMPIISHTPNEGVCAQITLEIFCENARKEELKFYQELERNKIYYCGIDLPSEIYTQKVIASSESNKAYINNEVIRINAMVKNISLIISKRFSSGGVLFVSTGGGHARRLAANLISENKKRIDLKANVHVLQYRSEYTKGTEKNIEFALALTSSVDSAEIKEIYKSLPCPTVNFDSNKKVPPLFEKIIDEIALSQSSFNFNSNVSTFTPLIWPDKPIKELDQTPIYRKIRN